MTPPEGDADPGRVVVAARGVSAGRGSTTVLRDVDLTIPAGTTGVSGPNGAGKTTLFLLCLGLLAPQAGRLTVLGADLARTRARSRARLRSRIGYAPEGDPLRKDVSAVAQTARLARQSGVAAQLSFERAVDTLRLLGLDEQMHRPVGMLSTGQRARVKLAQAICHAPELLLLDEPTNGLDPAGRRDVLAVVKDLAALTGASIVISSHVRSDLEAVADRVLDLGAARADPSICDTGPANPCGRVELLDPADRGVMLTCLQRRGLSCRSFSGNGIEIELSGPGDLDALRDVFAGAGCGVLGFELDGDAARLVRTAGDGPGQAPVVPALWAAAR